MGIIEDILSEENIISAINFLKGKGDKPDIDGMQPSILYEYWVDNKEVIKSIINNCTYEVGIVKQYVELSKKGKKRTVSVVKTPDKMLARAVTQVLAPIIDDILIDSCFAYRKGLGTKNIVEFARCQIESDKRWVAEVDVKDFFDTISHESLFAKLESIIDQIAIYRYGNHQRIIKEEIGYHITEDNII